PPCQLNYPTWNFVPWGGGRDARNFLSRLEKFRRAFSFLTVFIGEVRQDAATLRFVPLPRLLRCGRGIRPASCRKGCKRQPARARPRARSRTDRPARRQRSAQTSWLSSHLLAGSLTRDVQLRSSGMRGARAG